MDKLRSHLCVIVLSAVLSARAQQKPPAGSVVGAPVSAPVPGIVDGDRAYFGASSRSGTAKRLHSPGPAGSYGYTEAYDHYSYDPEKAKRLLREAGQPNLTFSVHHTPGRYLLSGQVLEAIQGYLRQVGVTMRVVDLEWGTLSQLAAQPVDKSQIQAAFFGWRSVNGDIDSAIQDFGSQFWRPAGNNISFYKSDEFDRLRLELVRQTRAREPLDHAAAARPAALRT